jgi:hypothetical protein
MSFQAEALLRYSWYPFRRLRKDLRGDRSTISQGPLE